MLSKLAFAGIKSRLKDYLVLFSGLIVSAATFYMFMALATNRDFLGKNSMISSGNTVIVFVFGAILLAIITLVYLIYANSFLLNMRQRDYGMFMMLGAKTGKIARLVFIETFSLGMIATIVGSMIGVGLSQVVAQLLVNQMGLTLHHFNAFYIPALLITLIFFGVMFIFAALWNSRKFVKTPVLKLLHYASQPNRVAAKPMVLILEAILGLTLLATGYWAMAHLMLLNLMAIPIALVTIVLGSYFTFNATFIWVIHFLKRRQKFAMKGLNNFTLSQLSFRLRDYTRMLAMISILFALALGAITVGLGFKNDIGTMAKIGGAYDLTVYTKNAAIEKKIDQLDVKSSTTYDYKVAGGAIYYQLDQLQKQPLYRLHYPKQNAANFLPTIKRDQASDYLKKDSVATVSLTQVLGVDTATATDSTALHLVSDSRFQALSGKTGQLTLIRVRDFQDAAKLIGEIQDAQLKAAPQYKDRLMNSKYTYFMNVNSLYSGMIFMGFFLGISFLAMLASCLMFKILSGAYSDIRRYDMLNKMGVRGRALKGAVSKEIGVLYALPGLLGIIHVLFGLQLFKALMIDPYNGIWIPFTIFIVLYGIYYCLTAWLYRGIVIPKVEIKK